MSNNRLIRVSLEIDLEHCVTDAQQLKYDLHAWLVEMLDPDCSGDINILVTDAIGGKDDITMNG